MTDDSKTELPAQLWAPWVTDRSTLHLVHDVPEDHDLRNHGACAKIDPIYIDVVRGPRVCVDAATPLDEWSHGELCRECVVISHTELAVAIQRQVIATVARRIRSTLVCCDSYDVCRPSALNENVDPDQSAAYHDICYWGEAAARLVEDPDGEDCDHAGGSWFDRMLCPDPCGSMHDRCVDCGDALDSCENRTTAYFRDVPGPWRRRRPKTPKS